MAFDFVEKFRLAYLLVNLNFEIIDWNHRVSTSKRYLTVKNERMWLSYSRATLAKVYFMIFDELIFFERTQLK